MKLAATVIEYLISLIIFVLFVKLGYWITGSTIDLGSLMVFYIILVFGSAFGRGIGSGIYAVIMRKEK